VGSSARPTSPRIPRQPFNPFETAAVLFMFAIVAACVGYTIARLVA